MLFTQQTKAAVAETLSHEQKISHKTEEKINIDQVKSHDLESNFYMEPNFYNTDTNDVKKSFEPVFDNDKDRKDFYMIWDRAVHSGLRHIYEKEILGLYD